MSALYMQDHPLVQRSIYLVVESALYMQGSTFARILLRPHVGIRPVDTGIVRFPRKSRCVHCPA